MNSEQKDEIEFLKAMFPETFRYSDFSKSSFEITVKSQNDIEFVQIYFSFPKNYPQNSFPRITTFAATKLLENEISLGFQRIFKENSGKVVMFDCIMWLKEILNDLEEYGLFFSSIFLIFTTVISGFMVLCSSRYLN